MDRAGSEESRIWLSQENGILIGICGCEDRGTGSFGHYLPHDVPNISSTLFGREPVLRSVFAQVFVPLEHSLTGGGQEPPGPGRSNRANPVRPSGAPIQDAQSQAG